MIRGSTSCGIGQGWVFCKRPGSFGPEATPNGDQEVLKYSGVNFLWHSQVGWGNLGLYCLSWASQIFSLITDFDDGILAYSVNEW